MNAQSPTSLVNITSIVLVMKQDFSFDISTKSWQKKKKKNYKLFCAVLRPISVIILCLFLCCRTSCNSRNCFDF